MWYCWVVGRDVGLPVVALFAFVRVDIMIMDNLIAAIDLVVATRTKAARVDVATGCSGLGLPGHELVPNALRAQRA